MPFSPRDALAPLVSALGDEDPHVRAAAAGALGALGEVAALEPLLVSLSDVDYCVRKASAEAIGRIGDARAVLPLVLFASRLHADDMGPDPDAAIAALVLIGAPAVDRLVGVLGSPGEHMDTAAHALVRIDQSRETAERLLALLASDEADTRQLCIDCLGEMSYRPALSSLIACLDDANPRVRIAAAEALGRLGDQSALPALAMALGDDGVSREASAGDTEAIFAPIHASTMRESVAEAMGLIGQADSTEALVELLDDESGNVRSAAASALGLIGARPAIAKLDMLLMDTEEDGDHLREVGGHAAEAIGRVGGPVAAEMLITFLANDSGSEDAVATAAAALGSLGGAEAVEPLIGALAHPSELVREAVAKSLGNMRDPRAVNPLAAAATRPSEHCSVRRACIAALGAIGNPAAVDFLVGTLCEQVELRFGQSEFDDAWDAELVKRQERDESAVGSDIYYGHCVDGSWFTLVNPMPDLEEPEDLFYDSIARTLGRLGGKGLVDRLAAVVLDVQMDAGARCWAAEALGYIGDSSAVEPLLAALRDENPAEPAVAHALGRIGDSRAAQPLIARLQRKGGAAPSVVWALGELGGPEAISALLGALLLGKAPSAIGALRRIGSPDAIGWLVLTLTESEYAPMRAAAARALGETAMVQRRLRESKTV